MPTSLCRRCTWGHTPASELTWCHVRRHFVSRRSGVVHPLERRVSACALSFYSAKAGGRKHESLLIVLLPREKRECTTTAEWNLLHFARMIRLLCSTSNRNGPKRQRTTLIRSDNISTVNSFYFHTWYRRYVTHGSAYVKKIAFSQSQSNPFYVPSTLATTICILFTNQSIRSDSIKCDKSKLKR